MTQFTRLEESRKYLHIKFVADYTEETITKLGHEADGQFICEYPQQIEPMIGLGLGLKMVRRNILVRATVEAVNYVQVQNGNVRIVGAILSDQTMDFSVMVDSIV